MKKFLKNLSFAAIALIFILLFFGELWKDQNISEWKYSDFISNVQKGNVVTKVNLKGRFIEGEWSDGIKTKKFTSYAPEDVNLVPLLLEKKILLDAQPEQDNPWWLSLLMNWFPLLLIIGFWIYMLRSMQVGGGKAMSFGKSRARKNEAGEKKVTFDDVAGVDEAKEELSEIIDFLKCPKKFTDIGAKIPRGVLLVGSPGTGKTLLARAVAGEAEVPFYSISGSDFVEMFVGVGASRVRDLFEQARKDAPCIIFIDEIDAVGRQRGSGLGGGHDEREQTLNQLLVEMDGFDNSIGIILIAATNRPDILDPALLRPGRFDRRVQVGLPDVLGREAILKVHVKKIKIASEVDLKTIAKGTPGFSGADLANLINEGALLAARKDDKEVTNYHFEEARDKIIMGPEKNSRVINQKEKEITAYHEAGHALLALLLHDCDPLHKVTIIPRGMAGGATWTLPTEDKHFYYKGELIDSLIKTFGGRAAEEIVFNEISSGASNDIKVATNLARRMVCQWGMSEKIGPVAMGHNEEYVFLGKELGGSDNHSPATALEIDREIRKILEYAYRQAKTILAEKNDMLKTIAEALIEKELLTGEEIEIILKESGWSEEIFNVSRSKIADLVRDDTSLNGSSDNSDSDDPSDESGVSPVINVNHAEEANEIKCSSKVSDSEKSDVYLGNNVDTIVKDSGENKSKEKSSEAKNSENKNLKDKNSKDK